MRFIRTCLFACHSAELTAAQSWGAIRFLDSDSELESILTVSTGPDLVPRQLILASCSRLLVKLFEMDDGSVITSQHFPRGVVLLHYRPKRTLHPLDGIQPMPLASAPGFELLAVLPVAGTIKLFVSCSVSSFTGRNIICSAQPEVRSPGACKHRADFIVMSETPKPRWSRGLAAGKIPFPQLSPLAKANSIVVGQPSNSSSWKLNISPSTPAAVPTPPPLPVLTAVKPGGQSQIGT